MRFRWMSGLVVVAFASTLHAAVPSAFSVQGVLRDGSGQLQSMMVAVSISLFDDQSAGNKLAGPYGPTTVMATNGLFTLPVQDAALATELGSAAQVWLEVTVGSDTFPRQLVTPQIFALMCGTADAAQSVRAFDSNNALSIGTGGGSGAGNFIESGASATTGSGQDLMFTNWNAHDVWMVIKADGKVGIGTTSPDLPLNVGTGDNYVGAGPGSQLILSASSPSQVAGVYLGGSGLANPTGGIETSWGAGHNNPQIGIGVVRDGLRGGIIIDYGGNVAIRNQAATNMYVTGGGFVGIGTTTPADQLDVANNVSVGGCLRNEAHTTTYSGSCTSDARLKTNVQPISHGLDKLCSLEPVHFEYKDPSHGQGTQSGFLAQDVEKIFPSWVTTGPDGYKRVAYGSVEQQMLTIQAIKELRAENAALRARLERIEARLDKRASR
jgi:hypothetical protein